MAVFAAWSGGSWVCPRPRRPAGSVFVVRNAPRKRQAPCGNFAQLHIALRPVSVQVHQHAALVVLLRLGHVLPPMPRLVQRPGAPSAPFRASHGHGRGVLAGPGPLRWMELPLGAVAWCCMLAAAAPGCVRVAVTDSQWAVAWAAARGRRRPDDTDDRPGRTNRRTELGPARQRLFTAD